MGNIGKRKIPLLRKHFPFLLDDVYLLRLPCYHDHNIPEDASIPHLQICCIGESGAP